MTRVVALVLALLLTARTAHADKTREAERQYAIGQTAYDDRRYSDAVAAWERSYDLSHEPVLLFNLGQAYRLRNAPGDCARARDDYGEFIAHNPTASQLATAGELFREMRQCADREAATRPDRLPPPVVVQPPMATPAPTPPPPPAPPHSHTMMFAGIAVAAVGVAALGTGLGFGARASSLSSQVQTACATGCNWADVRDQDADGRRDAHVGWALDGIGAAAAVVGGLLIWRGARDHGEAAPVAIAPTAGGAVVAWSGAW